jgi:hypothetical protein
VYLTLFLISIRNTKIPQQWSAKLSAFLTADADEVVFTV